MYIMMGTIGASLGSAYSFLMRIELGSIPAVSKLTTICTSTQHHIQNGPPAESGIECSPSSSVTEIIDVKGMKGYPR